MDAKELADLLRDEPSQEQVIFDCLSDALTGAMLGVSLALEKAKGGRANTSHLERSLEALSRAGDELLNLYRTRT